MTEKTLVIIPTYNELENLPLILRRLREAEPQVDVLVVDDNSPDGTGVKADELAAGDDQVAVLHRAEKTGLLGAYRAGFDYALDNDYDVVVEMDCDGSHAPEQLHLLLEQIDDGADVVIGSRYVEGGKVVNWPKNRLFLSHGGNAYIGVMLGTGLTDMTAGYRAIRRTVLETIDLDALSTKGYIFQVDFAYRAVQAGFDVREVPITFTEREHGESKLSGSFVGDSLSEVTKWGVQRQAEEAKNLANWFTEFVGFEYRRSALPRIFPQARAFAADGMNLVEHMGKLAQFEVERMGVKKAPAKVAGWVDDAKNLSDHMNQLVNFEVDRAKRAK